MYSCCLLGSVFPVLAALILVSGFRDTGRFRGAQTNQLARRVTNEAREGQQEEANSKVVRRTQTRAQTKAQTPKGKALQVEQTGDGEQSDSIKLDSKGKRVRPGFWAAMRTVATNKPLLALFCIQIFTPRLDYAPLLANLGDGNTVSPLCALLYAIYLSLTFFIRHALPYYCVSHDFTCAIF